MKQPKPKREKMMAGSKTTGINPPFVRSHDGRRGGKKGVKGGE